MDETAHIDTLRVRAPKKAAQQVRLRLSTKLGGADLHPPGLAPSQVLLVREITDPDPGGLNVDNTGAVLERTWERAVRDALDGALRQAIRPTSGRVPSGAEAVLFRDAAEAWACWGRAQIARGPSATSPWWMQSLETSSDATPASAHRSPSVAAVWRARPRLVPAMAAHLVAWEAAAEAVRQMSPTEAEEVLEAVCTAFDAPLPPTPQEPTDRADDQDLPPRPASSRLDGPRDTDEGVPEESPPEILPVSSGDAPWTPLVEETAGPRLVDALVQESPAHQQLLGVALTLRDHSVVVRSRAFQSAWAAWRQAPERSGSQQQRGARDESPHSSDASQDRSGEDGGAEGPEGLERKGWSPEEEDSFAESDSSEEENTTPVDGLTMNGDRGPAGPETTPTGEGEEPSWDPAYTATDLGGVLYLVNVLDILDLPACAETPPVGEHVGAWAVLEALARALLGPDGDALRPNDPLWRTLARLDGREPDIPAGRSLEDVEDASGAFRMPPAWLEAPQVDAPIDGQWAVTDGRLRMWVDLGCVVDLEAGDDPATQVEAEWDRVPNTGSLQRVASADTMPRAHEPADCAPALARWAARTAPYVRYRLASALGADDPEADWIADLFRIAGKLYTTDTHVDLMLPLDAAHLDARAAGLDRSPGWWPAGGRVVRFHFREADA